MKRRDLRTNEFEWHTTTFQNSRPMVRHEHMPKRPPARANWLGRMVDRLARLLSARQP
jgi:hypothetical protein